MSRNGGPIGAPQQSHYNNGNAYENHGGRAPGNGGNPSHPNQYPPRYPSYGHEQQHHGTTAPITALQIHTPQQPQTPLTHFEKCIARTRTIAHYKRIEQIGEGTYGQVYKASCLSSNRIVALKKIRLTSVATEGLPRTIIREIKILKALKHENMVQMLEVVTSKGCEYLDEEDEHKEDKKRRLLKHEAKNNKGENDSSSKEKHNNNDTLTEREKYKGNLFLVLEYISHDLSGILDMGVRFDPVQSKYIFKQLLSVLDYMHEQKYIHRDLKSSNILIDKKYRVKLADFGLARSIDDEFDWQNEDRKTRKLTNKVVTIWYRSPELLLGATDYDEKVDIWSAGCILAELLLGKALFPGTSDVEQLRLIFKMMGTPNEGNWKGLKSYPKVKSKDMEIGKPIRAEFRDKYGADDRFTSSPSAVALIERLLELDPKKRWRAKQALDSQYFRSRPTVPLNPDALGTIPILGDSHEFQTKPIRKQAKIVAQQASADAKKRGDNEKEAYESAYKEFLAKAAETGTFEVKRGDDKGSNMDREKGKDTERESDKEKRRRRRDRDESRDKRDRDNDEKDEQKDKRNKGDKYDGKKNNPVNKESSKSKEGIGDKRDSAEKHRDKNRRDREIRETSNGINNDLVKQEHADSLGNKGRRSNEKKESRSAQHDIERPSEDKKVKRDSRSRSRERDDKDSKRGRRDSHESSRDKRDRRGRDRSREKKEKRDKDRSRHRDRTDKEDHKRNRDKDRRDRSSDNRKDKDRRDRDRHRGSSERTRSRSRERHRRSKDSHDRDRNRRHDDIPIDERRRDDWNHQGRRDGDRDYGRRMQYPPREMDRSRDEPPRRSLHDSPISRDERLHRR